MKYSVHIAKIEPGYSRAHISFRKMSRGSARAAAKIENTHGCPAASALQVRHPPPHEVTRVPAGQVFDLPVLSPPGGHYSSIEQEGSRCVESLLSGHSPNIFNELAELRKFGVERAEPRALANRCERWCPGGGLPAGYPLLPDQEWCDSYSPGWSASYSARYTTRPQSHLSFLSSYLAHKYGRSN